MKRMQEFNRDRDVMYLQSLFSSTSILETVGVERKETRHSKFFEWLFKMPEINSVNVNSPIMHLLDLLIRRDQEQCNVLDDTFKRDVIMRNAKIEINDASTEVNTKGLKFKNKLGKIDLYIKAFEQKSKKKIHICIENKVYANEHDGQTIKYYAYMTGENVEGAEFAKEYKCPTNKGDEKIFVFLTPSSEFEMKKRWDKMCDSKYYIRINYQDIVDEILNPLVQSDTTPQSVKDKIEQYVCTLGIPGGGKDVPDTQLSKTIMASNGEIHRLAKQIFDEYKELIVDAVLQNKYKDFGNNHKPFLINLLSTINQQTTDEETYYKTQFLILRLSGKNNNYLVKNKGKFQIYIQNQLGLEFARLYCDEKLPKPINNVSGTVQQLNTVFASVKSVGLFSMSRQRNQKHQYLYDQIYDGYDIFFANNIWGSATYLPKLETFIIESGLDFEIIWK